MLHKKQKKLYLRIQTRVVLSVPAREVAFKDLCHFIAVGNHAQLRNPMDYGLGILSVLSSWRSLGVGYTQNMGDFSSSGSPFQPRSCVWDAQGGGWHSVTLWDASGAAVEHFLLCPVSTVFLGAGPRHWGHGEGMRHNCTI